MMKIPKRFRFLCKEWTVQYNETPDPAKPGIWASTSFRDQTITLRGSLKSDSLAQSFVHELLHVIFFEFGLNRANQINDEKEECLVDALANGIYALITEKVINIKEEK